MRCVTGHTTFDLQRCVLEDEWSLLVRMTLQTPRVNACCETSLLLFEAAVGIVTVAAFDQAFQHLVMKRPVELGLRFAVATDAELRLTALEHVGREQIEISSGRF